MNTKNLVALLQILLCAVLIVSHLGCGSSGAAPPAISVSLSKIMATVEIGATSQFTANVANDSANMGVHWSVSCSAPPCGSVSPTSTASGAPTTYTPPNSQTSALTVKLTATSASDATKSATATITVPALTVSLSSTSTTLQPGAQAQFSATVTNDGANAGVNWTVSCPQGPATCGSVSPSFTASGGTVTYTAGTVPPFGATMPVTLTATSVTDSAAAASATITIPGIVITISPNNPSVQSGGTQQFVATVTGDPSNGGVTWQVVAPHQVCNPLNRNHCGPVGYKACASCGAVSPSSAASGAPVTYTAPGTAPAAAYIEATSVTDIGAWTVVPINVLPISVAVSPSPKNVALSSIQQFAAAVTNDATNRGVTWSLTQNGAACSPACGTITPTTTASGAAVNYTAPANPPMVPSLMLTATSVEDGTKSAGASVLLTDANGTLACTAGSGQESLLEGQYAFLLWGFDTAENVATAGSFTADGKGHIAGGEVDSLHSYSGSSLGDAGITAAGSLYAVGQDHRGCLMLSNSAGSSMFFEFALGSINSSSIATKGHVIEFDDTATEGSTWGTGTLRLQDPTSFSARTFNGGWVFGLAGVGGVEGQAAMAGAITPDGTSTITGGTFDFNSTGTLTSDIPFTPATPFACCSANGRGTIGTGTLQDNGGAWVPQLTMYMIDSNDAFLVGTVLYNPDNNCCEATDALSLAGGEAFAAPGPFSNASLNGAMVFRSGGINTVDIGMENADGSGNLTGTDSLNSSGTFTTTNTAFTYSVGSNGRVTLTGGATPPVLYLYGTNQGLLLGTGSNVTVGAFEPQAGGPFSQASLSGAYMLGSETPASNLQLVCECLTFESGALTADGNGNASGTTDQVGPSGLADNQSLNFTYSIAANGTGNAGSGTTAIMISPNKLAYFNNTDPNPTITVVEK